MCLCEQQYAFLLTKNDEAEAGQETLIHVSTASVFKQSDSRSLALRLARAGMSLIFRSVHNQAHFSHPCLACYVHVEKYREVVQIARGISLHYQSHPDGLRLIQALVPSGAGSIEAFNGNELQKFSIRQLKLIEAVAKGKETKINKSGSRMIVGDAEDIDKDDEEGAEEDQRVNEANRFTPTMSNPMFLLSYAAMLMTSRSYQSAISALFYFSRRVGSLTELSFLQSTCFEHMKSLPISL